MHDSDHPVWPAADFSRVPRAVFTDRRVFDREQERIFQGPVWLFLGLACEIPDPGDFFTTYGGTTPLVVNRAEDGSIHAFVNRCAHRGSLVVRELRGNHRNHTCVYHRWCYDLEGNLIGVPYRRGAGDKGGLPPDFDIGRHGLCKLEVATYKGAIFGSFDPDVEPLADYLGEELVGPLDRFFTKPVEVMGYMRQRIDANWKAYFENLNDGIHAGLLHQQAVMMGLWGNTPKGGIVLDKYGRHSHYFIEYLEDDGRATEFFGKKLSLADEAFIQWVDEWGDNISTDTMSIFPNVMFATVSNFLMTEQIRLTGPDEFELLSTVVGYVDDDEERRALRQRQVAWLGPAGYVALEDSESGVLIQRAARGQGKAYSSMGYGGTGSIDSVDHVLSEVGVRGFWRYYCYLMGYRPEGAPPLDPATWTAAERTR